jgi:hypothetical protein
MHGGDQFGGHERQAASFKEAMHIVCEREIENENLLK